MNHFVENILDEDFYVGGLIETIFLADSFSAGPPFEVNILRGKFAVNNVKLQNPLIPK